MPPVHRRHRGGRRTHPPQDTLAVITITGGLIAFLAGLIRDGHFLAVCVGVFSVLFGLYSQMVSATTSERWLNVIGIGLAFVGAGLGLSHGGFRL
jgi:CHASE2 domain-containing sensor protein